MINASFSSSGRDAAISGAYQYDTGQRLRMHGLPSPSELAERDDFLSGDKVTVQVQYAFVGDSQTEASIAEWIEDEEGNGCWLAKVPDAYMLRNADVHVYVYVSYGQTETSMRSKTVYEAVFRPISRPAPSTNVTPDQTNEWDRLVGEINIALTAVGTAGSNANAAAVTATEAANAANEAARKAAADVNAYLSFLGRTDVKAERIEPYAEPTINVEKKTDDAGAEYTLVTFGMPQSVVTVNGQAAGEDGDITLTPEHVGALPATHQTVFEFKTIPPTELMTWTVDGNLHIYEMDVPGILRSDNPVVDIDFAYSGFGLLTSDIVDEMQESWAKVVRVDTYDDGIGLVCISGNLPRTIPPLRILCVR